MTRGHTPAKPLSGQRQKELVVEPKRQKIWNKLTSVGGLLISVSGLMITGFTALILLGNCASRNLTAHIDTVNSNIRDLRQETHNDFAAVREDIEEVKDDVKELHGDINYLQGQRDAEVTITAMDMPTSAEEDELKD